MRARAESCTANRPTPPDAPVIRTRRPTSEPNLRNARNAVTPATGMAAAIPSSTSSGTTASSAVSTARRSAHPPDQPKVTTRVPGGGPEPSAAADNTTPDASNPGTATRKDTDMTIVSNQRSGLFWDSAEVRAALPRAAATLGWELIDADPDNGTIEVAFAATEDFTTPLGTVLGGFLAAMLYDTVEPALLATLEPGQFISTLDLETRFLQPTGPGRIVGRGRVVRRDGDIAFLEASLPTSTSRSSPPPPPSCGSSPSTDIAPPGDLSDQGPTNDTQGLVHHRRLAWLWPRVDPGGPQARRQGRSHRPPPESLADLVDTFGDAILPLSLDVSSWAATHSAIPRRPRGHPRGRRRRAASAARLLRRPAAADGAGCLHPASGDLGALGEPLQDGTRQLSHAYGTRTASRHGPDPVGRKTSIRRGAARSSRCLSPHAIRQTKLMKESHKVPARSRARGGSRTRTALRPERFKPSASASSATRAGDTRTRPRTRRVRRQPASAGVVAGQVAVDP